MARCVLWSAGSRRWNDHELLGETSFLETVRLRGEFEPAADSLLERVPIAVLAAMAAKRRELAVGSRSDIDDLDVHARRASGAHPDLGHRIRFEAFDLEQLTVCEGVARIRIDGAQGGLARGEMIGVAGEDAREAAHRRLRDDALRLLHADHSRDIAAQLDARGQTAIGVAEERDVGHPDLRCSLGLFDAPDAGHLLAR